MDVLLRPLVWVVAAVSASALLSSWTWAITARGPQNRVEARLADTSANPRALLLARAVLLTAPLVLASWQRVISPEALGLALPSSTKELAIAIAIGVAAIAWIALYSTAFGRATGHDGTLARTPLAWSSIEAAALVALSLEAYWAFVRGAFLSVGLANGTLAVFLALGVIGLQGWASPGRRAQMLDPAGAAALSRGAIIAVTSALVFLAAGSLLVCVGVHLAIALTLLALGLESAPVPQSATERDPVSIEPTIV